MVAPRQSQVEERTNSLWIGDLPTSWDENTLTEHLKGLDGVKALKSIKVIRNKFSKEPDGYGFIEFEDKESAAQFLEEFNSTAIPQSPDLCFRLNWARHGYKVFEMQGQGADHAIFVGDLAADVTDYLLQETFKSFGFASVRSAKVIQDTQTGRSRGFGFVRFADESERDRALNETSGKVISGKAIRVSRATTKKAGDGQGSAYQSAQTSDGDPTNTTLFIGNLAPTATEEDLHMAFSGYGTIVYTKVPPGKACGFVQFFQRSDAENAMRELQGHQIHGSFIRISWGRASRNPGAHAPPPSQNYSYGYAQDFAGYGYGYENYPYPAGMVADPYAQWGYGAMPDPYGQAMYIPPVPTSTAPVATPPTATSAAMPAIPVTAGYAPGFRPFFVPAAKPMDPNGVGDHNKAYAAGHLPLFQWNNHFYRRAF